MSAPKIISKYTPVLRFLENNLFRFSQPGALNDPHEAFPGLSINKYSLEDYEVAQAKAIAAGMGSISKERLEARFLKPFPSGRFDEKSFPGLWPAEEPRLRKEPFLTLDELDIAVAERAVELCRESADKKVGIFSLTENTSEAMWAYYGSDHAGACVNFYFDHECFSGRIHKVVYSDIPIQVTTNMGWVRIGGQAMQSEAILDGQIAAIPLNLLTRKKMDWQHEREWRVIDLLSNASSVPGKDAKGFDVCLFRIPPDAIESIVFGYCASEESVVSAHEKIKSAGELKHILVKRRRLTASGSIEAAVV